MAEGEEIEIRKEKSMKLGQLIKILSAKLTSGLFLHGSFSEPNTSSMGQDYDMHLHLREWMEP